MPLFLEELTKAVLESAITGADLSTVPVLPLAVPATLHASLMARLDRLGPTSKELAQVGAAIGREFSYDLLTATAQKSETELRDAIGPLVEAGLILQRGAPPHATYLFKHALVQDAAYGTLLRGLRQSLHTRIGNALEEKFPELVDAHPELVAQHWARAGLIDKAITYWAKAAETNAPAIPAPRILRTVARSKPKPNLHRRVQHLAFVRQLPCVACGKAAPSEAAHVRTGTEGGLGMKPGDRYAVPLCTECHAKQHGSASLPSGPRSVSILSVWLCGCGLCRPI